MNKNEQILFPKDCPLTCPYLMKWDMDDNSSTCTKLDIQVNDSDLNSDTHKCPLSINEQKEILSNERYATIFEDNDDNGITIDDILSFGSFDHDMIGKITDGYHTFDSLYYQRTVLFAALTNAYPDISWKSFKHSDGQYCFPEHGEMNWFIVGIDTPEGSYTYHYEKKYWDIFKCPELECAKPWDGHTDKDVKRLLSLVNDSTTRWITDHNDGATRICERCGHCEPYKNAGIETEIFDYCPFCGRRVINKRS